MTRLTPRLRLLKALGAARREMLAGATGSVVLDGRLVVAAVRYDSPGDALALYEALGEVVMTERERRLEDVAETCALAAGRSYLDAAVERARQPAENWRTALPLKDSAESDV